MSLDDNRALVARFYAEVIDGRDVAAIDDMRGQLRDDPVGAAAGDG